MMKKPLIALAASIAMVAGAEAETKLYGKFNVTVDYTTTEADAAAGGTDDPVYSLSSHASRLGVKGKEDLGSAKAIYKMEYETFVDDGDKGSTGTQTFTQRNIYVGLDYGDLGSVRMGNYDTPLKVSQGKFDLFNDVVDIKNVLDGENRSPNQLNYTTGDLGGLKVSVSTIMSEVDGVGNGTSFSATYKAGGLYVSLAADDNIPGKSKSVQRLTTTYQMGDIRLGLLAQNVDEDDTAGCEGGDVKDCETLGYAANVSFKMGKNKLKAQYEMGDQKAWGATAMTVGVDHKLGKATTAYALYTMYEEEADDSGVSAAALGLVHKF